MGRSREVFNKWHMWGKEIANVGNFLNISRFKSAVIYVFLRVNFPGKGAHNFP